MASSKARFGGIVVASSALMFSLFLGCKESPPPPQASAPAPAAPAAPPAAVAPSQDANQVQLGMTAEQVQRIMGTPASTKQEGTTVEWKYYTTQGKVEIKLQNNVVAAIERDQH